MYSTEVNFCPPLKVISTHGGLIIVPLRSALKLLHCDDSCRMGENYVILVFLQVQHVKLEAASNDCTQ